jgi:hypothetical protein
MVARHIAGIDDPGMYPGVTQAGITDPGNEQKTTSNSTEVCVLHANEEK